MFCESSVVEEVPDVVGDDSVQDGSERSRCNCSEWVHFCGDCGGQVDVRWDG